MTAASLTLDEEADLFIQMASLDPRHRDEARRTLVERNRGLVYSIAKKYVDGGIDEEDLVQEGYLGLLKAIDKFDYTRGWKFSTYAIHWIRQTILRALANGSRTMRVSEYMHYQLATLKRVRADLTQLLGENPTLGELTEALLALGWNKQKVEQAMKVAAVNMQYLSAPIRTTRKEGNWATLADIIDDPTAGPEDLVVSAATHDEVRAAVALLPPVQQYIIINHFGLFGMPVLEQRDMAAILGISHQAISRHELNAKQFLAGILAPMIDQALEVAA